MAKRKIKIEPQAAKTPQGAIVAETPSIRSPGIAHNYADGNRWLGDLEMRYGAITSSLNISTNTKQEMLRDEVIAFCHAFTIVSLVNAVRVIVCKDEGKRRFFEAMFRAFEPEYIKQAGMAIPMGAVGLIKKFKFAVPMPVELDAPPVWDNAATPFICVGFDQLAPSATPNFVKGHFAGINTSDRTIDRFYSLWIPLRRENAFGSYGGFGRIETAYHPWWNYKFLTDQFAVHTQRNIDRVVKVGYPPGRSADGTDNQKVALAIGDAVRSGATVAIPTTSWEQEDSATGEKKLTSNPRWMIEFMEGVAQVQNFVKAFDFFDSKKALGYLVPPQGFLKVGGGDLGGPTTADVLMTIAEGVLLLEASDLDFALNTWVFPAVDHANFPPDSPSVRVKTVGLSKYNRSLMAELIKLLLTGAGIDPSSVLDVDEMVRQLSLPQPAKSQAGVNVQESKPTDEAEGEAEGKPSGEAEGEPGGEVGSAAMGIGKTKAKGKKAKPENAIVPQPIKANEPQLPAKTIRELARGDILAEDDEGDGEVTLDEIQTVIERLRDTTPELFDGLGGG